MLSQALESNHIFQYLMIENNKNNLISCNKWSIVSEINKSAGFLIWK